MIELSLVRTPRAFDFAGLTDGFLWDGGPTPLDPERTCLSLAFAKSATDVATADIAAAVGVTTGATGGHGCPVGWSPKLVLVPFGNAGPLDAWYAGKF